MTSYDLLWRAAELTATPWRNGGGSTYEIASEPAGSTLDDFDWRISIAAVDAPGPFSTFEGVDRIIALIDGPSMQLRVDGTLHVLKPLEQFAFAGESRTTCEIPDGPTRDLNVMTRRGKVSAAMDLAEVPGALEIAAAWRLVLVAIRGSLAVGPVRLDPLDGLVSRGTTPLTVRGTGVVAVVRLAG